VEPRAHARIVVERRQRYAVFGYGRPEQMARYDALRGYSSDAAPAHASGCGGAASSNKGDPLRTDMLGMHFARGDRATVTNTERFRFASARHIGGENGGQPAFDAFRGQSGAPQPHGPNRSSALRGHSTGKRGGCHSLSVRKHPRSPSVTRPTAFARIAWSFAGRWLQSI
jgi:hypothetical protein